MQSPMQAPATCMHLCGDAKDAGSAAAMQAGGANPCRSALSQIVGAERPLRPLKVTGALSAGRGSRQLSQCRTARGEAGPYRRRVPRPRSARVSHPRGLASLRQAWLTFIGMAATLAGSAAVAMLSGADTIDSSGPAAPLPACSSLFLGCRKASASAASRRALSAGKSAAAM